MFTFGMKLVKTGDYLIESYMLNIQLIINFSAHNLMENGSFIFVNWICHHWVFEVKIFNGLSSLFELALKI